MSLDYNDIDEQESQPNELRSYKDALTFYNKNASKTRKPQSTNYSNRSVLSQQQQSQLSDRYINNPLQENASQDPKEIVYSISSSYAQPGIQANLSAPSELRPSRPVDENIYSQVVASSLRRSTQPDQLVDDQPVYMNTPYNLALQAELNQAKQDSSRTTSQRNFSYRDSSL